MAAGGKQLAVGTAIGKAIVVQPKSMEAGGAASRRLLPLEYIALQQAVYETQCKSMGQQQEGASSRRLP